LPDPILATYAGECGSTGAPERSAFHGLLAGKTEHPPTTALPEATGGAGGLAAGAGGGGTVAARAVTTGRRVVVTGAATGTAVVDVAATGRVVVAAVVEAGLREVVVEVAEPPQAARIRVLAQRSARSLGRASGGRLRLTKS
jgi:hypothetical protein